MKLHGTWSTLHQEPHLISPISPISLPTVSALHNVLRPRSKDGCAPSAQEQGTDPYPPSGVGNSCFAAAWCRCHVVGCSFALEPPVLKQSGSTVTCQRVLPAPCALGTHGLAPCVRVCTRMLQPQYRLCAMRYASPPVSHVLWRFRSTWPTLRQSPIVRKRP